MIEPDSKPSLMMAAERQLVRFPKHANPRQAPGVALSLLRAWAAEDDDPRIIQEHQETISAYKAYPNVTGLRTSLWWLMRNSYENPEFIEDGYRQSRWYRHSFEVLMDALDNWSRKR